MKNPKKYEEGSIALTIMFLVFVRPSSIAPSLVSCEFSSLFLVSLSLQTFAKRIATVIHLRLVYLACLIVMIGVSL